MFLYLIIFIAGGISGWLIDTTYRTWYAGRYTPNTLVPFFSLIYGLAAVFLYILFTFVSASIFFHIISGLVIVVLLELFSGVISVLFLKRRLWNYSDSRFNFYGFVDLQHSFYWLLLVSIYRVLYPVLF